MTAILLALAIATWSTGGTVVGYGEVLEVRSPDGKGVVSMSDDAYVTITIDGAPPAQFPVLAMPEVLWSPDSKAVAITDSEGGEASPWIVKVYRVDRGALRPVDVTLGKAGSILGAVAWARGSRELVVVGRREVALRGYRVRVPSGSIKKEYDEPKLREKWGGKLGARLAR